MAFVIVDLHLEFFVVGVDQVFFETALAAFVIRAGTLFVHSH
jgi:hypothetical protein